MNFTSQDIAIIEKALKTAMASETNEYRSSDYREVLLKLQQSAKQVLEHDAVISAEALDGLRYDYDDSSDML